MSQKHWAVSVSREGETILTIESNCLAGRDLSAEDQQCVRDCARHLLSFVGDNPLQVELLDLITLMPDSQTQEIVDYIAQLREIRSRRR